MRILGLDPGFGTTGYGIIDHVGSKLTHIAHGAIKTTPNSKFSKRLVTIEEKLDEIITLSKPNAIAIEELFFNTNTTTAIKVAQARGVMILCAEHHKVELFEYTPPQVKSSVVGYGAAQKNQVQYMVQKLLNLKDKPRPDDAADALAIAICHAHSARIKAL